VRDNSALQAVVESVNRYSLTVYDINIGDSQSITLLSTNPDNEDKPLPVRANYKQLRDANPLQLMRQAFGAPKVFDVVVPLERNGQPVCHRARGCEHHPAAPLLRTAPARRLFGSWGVYLPRRWWQLFC